MIRNIRNLLALELIIFSSTVSVSAEALTSNDATVIASAVACVSSEGANTAACAVTAEAIGDYLRTTTEVAAWEISISCNGGDASKSAHDAYITIRNKARNWANEPYKLDRMQDLAKHTGSGRTMCMFNSIVGATNCKAFLDALPGGSTSTTGWRSEYCL